MRRGIVIAVAVLLGLCLVLSAAGGLAYLLWPRAVARPMVLIKSPRHGEQVEVGQTVTVRSIARDEGKVARIELWVDGQLQDAQTTSIPGGISPLPLAASWEPLSPGTHTLTVRAFNPQGGRGHASINVEAVEETDRDGDGVAGLVDACPDEPGSATAEGCPDRDRDGIPDAEDACPDEVGLPQGEGCPVPSEGDGDGDGVLDDADACPDELGPPWADGCPDADGDGVDDSEDACPAEPGFRERDGCLVPGDRDTDGILDGEDACPGMPGLPERMGCPDDDGDGVAGMDDLCPEEPGLPELAGCPDRDGDGIADSDDLCPDQPGLPEDHGCPDTGAGDRDGDTVPDDVDLCPDEPGLPEHAGCPPPGGGEDADDGGIPDDLEGPADFLSEVDSSLFLEAYTRMELPVEFQALELEVGHDYEQVWCYAGLAGGARDHYGPFEPLGERRWDIAAYLGGDNSRHVRVPSGEQLQLWAECLASISGEDEPYHLGEISSLHSASDWDGHVISVSSAGGDEGHSFHVSYRVCSPSCEEAAFPAPNLSLLHGAGDHRLLWSWGGDRESIDGFTVYLNDTYLFDLAADRYSHSVGYLEPPCGERMEFEMTAYSGHTFPSDRESPRSNTVYWEGEACPRTVRVTFERLTTHDDIGEDEYTGFMFAHGGPYEQGPILGAFRASSSSDFEAVSFDGAHCFFWMVAHGYGVHLRPSSEMEIQEDIFDVIRTEWEPYRDGLQEYAPYFDGPDHNYVLVQLGADDNLTIRGLIRDDDYWSGEDTLFDVELELRPEQVVSGPQILSGRHMDLTVLIEVLESP
ncbi:MAG: Ig-like domain-containing protein [Anaerolineae bacterium]|nr:Ig-like domain-containing protein [Anaerolineae bacterium]